MTVHKAVILAAGHGTRFLPATKAIPKEMLPLVDKPVIQYVVEEAVEAGLHNITIVTAGSKRSVEDHFDSNPELEQLLASTGKEPELREIRRVTELAGIAFVAGRKRVPWPAARITALWTVMERGAPFPVLRAGRPICG